MKKLLALSILALCFLPTGVHATATAKAGTSTESLVGWWTFDEGSTTLAHDFSGNGNSGTLNNLGTTSTATSGWIAGKRGKALVFDGVNDYVTVPNSPSLSFGTGAFTFSAWVYKTNAITVRGDILNHKTTGFDFGIFLTTSGVIQMYKDGTIYTGTRVINPNNWYLITVTRSASGSWKVYINGVQDGTASNSTSMTNAADWWFGANNNLGVPSFIFSGKIDDIRMYNRELSAADALSLYTAGEVTRKVSNNTNLVGYWPFDEGSTTKAGDLSGRGNNGTLVNAPVWTTGKRGKGIAFTSASSQYVEVASNPSLDFTGDFSVSGWFKLNSAFNSSSAASVILVEKYSADTSNMVIALVGTDYGAGGASVPRGTLLIKIEPTNGNTRYIYSSRTTWEAGKWYHFTTVLNSADQRNSQVFVNGVDNTGGNLGAGTFVGSVNYSARWRIGGTNGDTSNIATQRFLNGSMDDVRIYGRSLTASEILTLYKQGETVVNGSQVSKLTSGLVGYWSFNGKDINWTTSTAYDTSGAGNNATTTGLTKTAAPVAGKLGQALLFSGVPTQYVQRTSGIALTTFSIGSWFKTSGGNASTYRTIVSKQAGSDSTSRNYWFGLSGSNAATYCGFGRLLILYSVSASIDAGHVCSNARLDDDKWHFGLATYDGATLSLYVDGTLQTTLTIGAPDQQTGATLIGMYSDYATQPFSGAIDEVRIYNRALTGAEAKQLYLMNK